MEGYDYKEAIKRDISNWLEDHDYVDYGTSINEVYVNVYDDCFRHVTGYSDQSYTCNKEEAEQYVKEGGEDHIIMMANKYIQPKTLVYYFATNDYEQIDLLIREYLYGSCLEEVLKEQWPNKGYDGESIVYYDLEVIE